MTTDLRLETPVLTPAAALEAGEARVGGKAIGLAKLAAAGVPVPRWVVLPVEAFEHDLGPDLLAVVKEAIGSEGPFAVRSSAVGEDSSTHSFAGIYDSFL
ncbi:MAG: PEP/pyruvate-binding domain-containing protein, partial [Thermoleophilaceae bacterium]